MTTLSTNTLSLAYDEALIVDAMTLTIPDQRITALVGPNGCGKSTLLRGLARLLAPRAGVVLLDGRAIHQTPTKELAKRLGILPQGPVAPEGLTVRELVAQGRYPHQRWYQQWSETDEQATRTALDKTGLSALADRAVDALSGGQRQRAWIAMTLAQQTQILLLDEPTTYLDMSHQLEVMHLLRDLNADGATIVLVVHDLNLAARFAHHMIAMSSGKIAASGAPADVMTVDMMRDVFSVEADIVRDPRLGVPLCLPYDLRA